MVVMMVMVATILSVKTVILIVINGRGGVLVALKNYIGLNSKYISFNLTSSTDQLSTLAHISYSHLTDYWKRDETLPIMMDG